MFSVKDKRRIDALNEHNRAVNKAWKCGSQMDDYHLPDEYKYFGGSQGGIESKLSAHIIDKVTNGCSIVDLFLEYVSLSDVFEPMARYTQQYACEEYIAPFDNNVDVDEVGVDHVDVNMDHVNADRVNMAVDHMGVDVTVHHVDVDEVDHEGVEDVDHVE